MYDLPNDRERAALVRIANALTGSSDESAAGGNRIAYALERIATFLESHVISLPTVAGTDEGKILKVNSSGKWAAASEAVELPAVTAEDVGKILKVNASGEWEAAEA